MGSYNEANKFAKDTACDMEKSHFFKRMMQKGEHIEEEIMKAGDNLDHYIKKYPVKATVIAGVVGLLLGKFLAK